MERQPKLLAEIIDQQQQRQAANQAEVLERRKAFPPTFEDYADMKLGARLQAAFGIVEAEVPHWSKRGVPKNGFIFPIGELLAAPADVYAQMAFSPGE